MATGKKKIKVFSELHEALEDALRYENGERVDLRVTELPPPPKGLRPHEIREIRQSLNASQTRFARFLNVSANTVESWEQGTRQPQHAALKLLAIAKKRPKILLES
ncbi:MAG TPA: helix-turn-helix domain-containing protein [Candidatus Acidoferrales bacterium]|jgi:putative transcriptional regulator|nr:helix-turn-helix domain-containing protein [Candidatus Acidoferrales bacterium]